MPARLPDVELPGDAELDEMARRVLDAAFGDRPDRTAHYAEDGAWVYRPIDEASRWIGDDYDHGNWTSGFWAGALIELDRLGCRTEGLVERARELTGRLACRADDRGTHDLGFIFWPSAALVATLYGDATAAGQALRAAGRLAERQVSPSGHLQAFGQVGEDRSRPTSTIDTMMNLPLLLWAGRHTGDPSWTDVARRHADRTAHSLLRPDGSTYHLARIADDGTPTWQGTFQGADDASCWTRGQAWAISGYLIMAAETGEPRYADLACRLLDYYCARHDLTGPTPYDLLRDTGLTDSSAAAIVGYGLARVLRDAPDLAERAQAAARLPVLLRALREHALLDDAIGLLAHACYSAPHRRGVNGPLPYGDYYYLATLSLLTEAH